MQYEDKVNKKRLNENYDITDLRGEHMFISLRLLRYIYTPSIVDDLFKYSA